MDGQNPFTGDDYGQCPYWAAEKYPAIVLDQADQDAYPSNWNGFTWLEHGRAEALATSTAPASGDLAVWQATPDDPDGHVAYVEAVLAHGIIVSQMDGRSDPPYPPNQGSTEYIPRAALSYFAANDGLEYVVTGDPSTTPTANLETSPAAFGDGPAAGGSRPAPGGSGPATGRPAPGGSGPATGRPAPGGSGPATGRPDPARANHARSAAHRRGARRRNRRWPQ